MRPGCHVEALIQDLRFSLRWLLREWTFTLTVLVTLALGIGSTTAVFTLVDVLLLRPLPVKSPDELFTLSESGRNVDLTPSYYSHEFYERLRHSNPLFGNLPPARIINSRLIRRQSVQRCGHGSRAVRTRIRKLLRRPGVGAAAGRILRPDDDRTPGSHPVVVLSYAFWERRFARAPEVVGRTVSVNGIPFTVVGVAKRGFFGTKPGFGPDIWAPLMMVRPVTPGSIGPMERSQNYLEMMVRLDPSIEVGHAQAMATAVYANWLDVTPSSRPRAAIAPTLHLR